MQAELLVLRIVHIVGAVVWAGTGLFVALFLLPALNLAGPAGAPVMGALVKKKLFTIIPIVAVVTMLAGLRLLWLISNGYSAAFFKTPGGSTYAFGALCAIAAFVVFMSVNHPAIGKMTALGAQMAQASEVERGAIAAQIGAVRARAGTGTKVSASLLALAAIAMAVGRYM